jgi:hypothetical protein
VNVGAATPEAGVNQSDHKSNPFRGDKVVAAVHHRNSSLVVRTCDDPASLY